MIAKHYPAKYRLENLSNFQKINNDKICFSILKYQLQIWFEYGL